jgi:hypothetical protein
VFIIIFYTLLYSEKESEPDKHNGVLYQQLSVSEENEEMLEAQLERQQRLKRRTYLTLNPMSIESDENDIDSPALRPVNYRSSFDVCGISSLLQSCQGKNKSVILSACLLSFLFFILASVVFSITYINTAGHDDILSAFHPMPKEIYIEDEYVHYPIFNHTANSTAQKPFQLLLYGDSLIYYPTRDHRLVEKLYDDIYSRLRMEGRDEDKENFQIQISSRGLGGETVLDLMRRMGTDVLKQGFDGIIIFWDSDLSDYPVSYLQNATIQEAFRHNLTYFLDTIKQDIPFVGFACPELLGEGFLFKMSRFQRKGYLLDKYRVISQEVGQKLSIPYINIRKAFQELIPSWWISSMWYITFDGEHPNEYGAKVESKYFAEMFMRWYKSKK